LIDPKIVAETRRLLTEAKPLSQRQIAIRLKISRGTVAAIASGRRPDYLARQIDREDLGEADNGPKVRCLGCGGLQSLPCRVCRDRKAVEATKTARLLRNEQALVQGRRPPDAEQADPDALNLNLPPECQSRYEELHRQKRGAGEDQTADGWDEPQSNEEPLGDDLDDAA
jgi:hypothetical protein